MAGSKVKTLSIVSIVLGALGLLGAFSGAVAFLADPGKIMGATGTVHGETATSIEVQQDMSKAVIALTESWRNYNGVVALISFFVSAALLAGGIMCLKLGENGRRVLVTTFVMAIPFKVIQGIASVYIGVATMQIMGEYMPKLMRASTPTGTAMPAGVEGVASGLAQGSAMFGIALGVGWLLLQIGFYVAGTIYLRKPDVRATFSA
jgi:hypothetical protein